MAFSALLNVMVQAAMKAGRSLTRDFGEVENLQVSRKGPADFVTAADKKAEKIIRQNLQKARPGYSFLMEEGGEIKGDPQHRWIIDPLDGTTNFLHSMPVFAVSIALETQGQLMAGVVYNPVMDELFTAEKGQGAYLNDRRLRVANRRYLPDTVIATGIPALNKIEHSVHMKGQKKLMSEVAGIRATGSAALNLAWLAAGRFDGYFEDGLSPWDVAAGALLVREAGGFVADPTGGPGFFQSGSIIAGNEFVFDNLKALLGSGKSSRS